MAARLVTMLLVGLLVVVCTALAAVVQQWVATKITNDELLTLDVDVLVPAAKAPVRTAEDLLAMPQGTISEEGLRKAVDLIRSLRDEPDVPS